MPISLTKELIKGRAGWGMEGESFRREGRVRD